MFFSERGQNKKKPTAHGDVALLGSLPVDDAADSGTALLLRGDADDDGDRNNDDRSSTTAAALDAVAETASPCPDPDPDPDPDPLAAALLEAAAVAVIVVVVPLPDGETASALQSGQYRLRVINHGSIQVTWNSCLHGKI